MDLAEKQFTTAKNDESVPATKLNGPLKQYRDICEDLSLLDPLLAAQKDIDDSLLTTGRNVTYQNASCISEIRCKLRYALRYQPFGASDVGGK